jgi:mannosyltransferase
VGAFGFLVSVAASWQPSFWGDEAASVMSAERSLPSLFRMLGHIDAVHGTYYVFLHYWIGLFGASEFSVRFPSAIAIGVAAAGTAVLARRLVNARVGVIAGLVFSVLPRVTYMGSEARSIALATAIVVWVMVMLVHLLRRDAGGAGGAVGTAPVGWAGRTGWAGWAGWAVLFSAGIYMFLYTVLLIPVYALAVLLFGSRRTLVRWAIAAAGGLIVSIPVMVWGVRERRQISFIGRRPQVDLPSAAVQQWFGNSALAVLAWALILLAVVAGFIARRRLGNARAIRRVLTVALAWMLIPSAVLFIGTRLVTPMYSLRYLSICAPAAAIVIAIGVASVRYRWLRLCALALIAVLAAPTYVSQRGEFGKNDGSDWRQAAAVVQTGARPGDAIVFDETTRPSRRPRLAMHLYPDAFRGLRDVTLKRPYQHVNWLWDTTKPLDEVTDQLANTDTVWLLQYNDTTARTGGSDGFDDPSTADHTDNSDEADLRTLQQAGFRVENMTTVNRTVVVELTR